MKNRIIYILLFFASVFLGGLFSYSEAQNSKLTKVIDDQNAFIKEVTGKQSKVDEEYKEYLDSVTAYSKTIRFLLKGHDVNFREFVKMYDELSAKNDSLTTELDRLKFKYRTVEKKYGFSIKESHTKGKSYYEVLPFTRADSAAVALQFFRDRLKITKNGWEIDTTGPKDLKEMERELRKLNQKYKTTVDSAVSK